MMEKPSLRAVSRRGMLAAFAIALAVAMGVIVGARPALANYGDVSNDYPASQEVTTSGDAIPASKIPDGSYQITASTSSFMCRITDCTLNVKNDKMTVTFTMSSAYTRIYFGTAQQAASKTNAKGTDDSAYYKGAPSDGYAPHVYTVPIASLNTKITLSTYSGATSSRKWYTRTVVFNSSATVNEAVASGKAKPDPKPEPQGEEAGSGSKDGKGQQEGTKGAADKPQQGESGTGPRSTSGQMGSTAAKRASGTGPASNAGSEESDVDRAGKIAEGESKKKAPAAGKHGVEVVPVTAPIDPGDIEGPVGTGGTADDGKDGIYRAVLAGVLVTIAALLVVLGVAIRRTRHFRS